MMQAIAEQRGDLQGAQDALRDALQADPELANRTIFSKYLKSLEIFAKKFFLRNDRFLIFESVQCLRSKFTIFFVITIRRYTLIVLYQR